MAWESLAPHAVTTPERAGGDARPGGLACVLLCSAYKDLCRGLVCWHGGARWHDPTRRCRHHAIHGREKEKTMQTMWLLGGLGLGAGLMYLMDPEKGEGRRNLVRGHVVDYGRQTGDLLDDTRRTLGRQAQAVLATTRMTFRHQPGL